MLHVHCILEPHVKLWMKSTAGIIIIKHCKAISECCFFFVNRAVHQSCSKALSKLALTLGQNHCKLGSDCWKVKNRTKVWEETHRRQWQWPRSFCVGPQCSWPRRCSCRCRPVGSVWWSDYGLRWWRNWGQSWGRSAPRSSATPPGGKKQHARENISQLYPVRRRCQPSKTTHTLNTLHWTCTQNY